MNSVGDAFGWAFRDPSWAGKMIVQALITIIPIVGWIATAGWLMLAFDSARSGRNELPPAGFHLARGIGLFGVLAIYYIVLNIPAWILEGIGSATNTVNNANFNGYNYSTYYNSSPLGTLGSGWSLIAGLFLDFLAPSLVVMTYHNGFGGGLDIGRVWRYATTNVGTSVIAGLCIFAANFIAGLSIILCCVGLFFGIVYAATVQAGVAAWFERTHSAPAAPGAPAA